MTKNALGNLINRYKAVLKKCTLINIFGSLAVAGMVIAGGTGTAKAGISSPFDSLMTYIINGGSNPYDMDKDIDAKDTIQAPDVSLDTTNNNKTINMNGHTLSGETTAPKPFASGITIGDSSHTLTIDGGTGAIITNFKRTAAASDDAYGSVINNQNGGTVKFTNTITFSNNSAYQSDGLSYGGAIYNEKGTITFEANSSAVFQNNSAYRGGAICNKSAGESKGEIYFKGTASFIGNSGQGDMGANGGAIYNDGTITFEKLV